MPAYFNNTIYYGSMGDAIKAFKITNAKLSTGPSFQSSNSFPYPGTTPSISANGTSNAIVWAAENGNTAVLHAYDASNLHELYNSNQAASGRDQFGTGNKFITPTDREWQSLCGDDEQRGSVWAVAVAGSTLL